MRMPIRGTPLASATGPVALNFQSGFNPKPSTEQHQPPTEFTAVEEAYLRIVCASQAVQRKGKYTIDWAHVVKQWNTDAKIPATGIHLGRDKDQLKSKAQNLRVEDNGGPKSTVKRSTRVDRVAQIRGETCTVDRHVAPTQETG
eukprot:gb/GEZN01007460.1/.p1 GENE.gb/GEZN01007460.1/~~gb/GEZN01007460.1/.p1  ORF type:complete len:144 (+),score=13.28 gb/GEZN01007460.1/:298-729(+)